MSDFSDLSLSIFLLYTHTPHISHLSSILIDTGMDLISVFELKHFSLLSPGLFFHHISGGKMACVADKEAETKSKSFPELSTMRVALGLPCGEQGYSTHSMDPRDLPPPPHKE